MVTGLLFTLKVTWKGSPYLYNSAKSLFRLAKWFLYNDFLWTHFYSSLRAFLSQYPWVQSTLFYGQILWGVISSIFKSAGSVAELTLLCHLGHQYDLLVPVYSASMEIRYFLKQFPKLGWSYVNALVSCPISYFFQGWDLCCS